MFYGGRTQHASLSLALLLCWLGSVFGFAVGLEDRTGAVSSESRTCSEVGIGLLQRGGNAADALVGTVLCVGVIGMQHSGIGGGGFMLVRDSDGRYESIDFRETAPAAAFENMYQGNVIGSVRTGLASAVPSDLRGLEYLHNKYGLLPWRAVCNPAVYIARHGFAVTEDLVRYMKAALSSENMFLIDDPQFSVDFAPNGTLLGLGDILTRKRYANTLEAIAEHGADAFYSGEIANYTISALQAANGTMTLDDLKNYKVTIRKPISINYRGYRVFSTGAPSGGSVALSILKIIEGYNMSDPAIQNLNFHRLDEAMRFSYGARAELGDPDFFDHMEDFEVNMLKSKRAAEIRSLLSDDHTQKPAAYDPKRYIIPESHGTSHIVTADTSGMTITLTSTVNLLFGSQLVVPETGVIMNNEMNDFSIPGVSNEFGFVPSPINYIRPNKRPLSSITPLIVEHANGSLYLSIGAAGGSRIITGSMQGVWHVLDHGMSLPEALLEPRIHDQLLPNIATVEYGFDNDTVDSLRSRGHNVTWVRPGFSAVQGVRVLSNGTFEAASEPRQMNSGGLAT
ncbi:gamma-glutamyltranspeptidase-like protein [Calycina marina]|uniref:Glutathione hydrolase n=1 Tax=Calycina marina TaxID=1763456 RepID=A0A9P7Z1X7_9HELO|nr:gamma-glutamyltranspeptidase-like protein [Calycina marina]